MGNSVEFASYSAGTMNTGWPETVLGLGCLRTNFATFSPLMYSASRGCSGISQSMDCASRALEQYQHVAPCPDSPAMASGLNARDATLAKYKDISSKLKRVGVFIKDAERKLDEAGTILYGLQPLLRKRRPSRRRSASRVTSSDVRLKLAQAKSWVAEAKSDLDAAKDTLEKTMVERRLAKSEFDVPMPDTETRACDLEKAAQSFAGAVSRYLDATSMDIEETSWLFESRLECDSEGYAMSPSWDDDRCDTFVDSIVAFGSECVECVSNFGTAISDLILGPSMSGRALNSMDKQSRARNARANVAEEYPEMEQHPVWVQKALSKYYSTHPEAKAKLVEALASRDLAIARRDAAISRNAARVHQRCEFEKAVNDFRLVIGGFNISVLSVMKERSCAA